MKNVKSLFLVTTLSLAAALPCATTAQSKSRPRQSPQSLVIDLYRQHNHKHSPFFQTRSRALLDKYFEKSLANLLWKDANTNRDEVGAIDGDPLYDAQDMEIKKFAISKPRYENGKAGVTASFENFGEKKEIVFVLVPKRTGWKIEDIKYPDGTTLAGLLSGKR